MYTVSLKIQSHYSVTSKERIWLSEINMAMCVCIELQNWCNYIIVEKTERERNTMRK